jgi:hypothetical protein
MNWFLDGKILPNFTLAADSRLGHVCYTNDIIWDFCLRGGEPAAISLQTTFGLRARWMRLFPRFSQGDHSISDPFKFHQPPNVQVVYPNYLRIAYEPFHNLLTSSEYWVPQSDVICGRIIFTNPSLDTLIFSFDWVAILSFLGKGEGMAMIPIGLNSVLQGKTSNLSLVCFMTGGPQPSPGPQTSLHYDFNLPAGQNISLVWALSAQPEVEAALKTAQSFVNRPWDAETSRIELMNKSRSLEITTGDPEWDVVFALSQQKAWNLFLSSTGSLPFSSFVLSRRPDQGYSFRGDGSDFTNQWNGQTVMETLYLSSFILPGGILEAEGLLRNFLSTQLEDGTIDWRPGLAGQRTYRLAQPLLATLAVEIDSYKYDHAWLKEIFPPLLKFTKTWFDKTHDRDGDGFPEWDHAIQTGLPDAPTYDRWDPLSLGMDINQLESPSLVAMLYMECMSLAEIADRIGNFHAQDELLACAKGIKDSVHVNWDRKSGIFHYRDFQTHNSPIGMDLLKFKSVGSYRLRKILKPIQRISIQLLTTEYETRPLLIQITGKVNDETVKEEITSASINWNNGLGNYSGSTLYSYIERVNIEALPVGAIGSLFTPNLQSCDISLLLPLWSGLMQPDDVRQLVEKQIQKAFFRPFGLPVTPDIHQDRNLNFVNLMFAQWILEGLVMNGYRQLAAEIFVRQMSVILHCLRQTGGFKEYYHADSGQSHGEVNSLPGMLSPGLFLNILGVKIINANEVHLVDFNPFPWPITVKYQGMMITRHSKDSVVVFPTGQIVDIYEPGTHRITLS